METYAEAILLETKVTSVEDDEKGLAVSLEGKNAPSAAQVFDRVLVAVGRRPNSAIAGLDTTRAKVNQRGFIEVDGQRRTAEPSIFAIGDVAGDPMLAHKASHEARVAVEAIHGKSSRFEPRAIPAVVFTDPELAWTGLTETDARKQNIPIEIAKYPWAASGRATTLDRPDGLTKLIIDPGTERVLGVGIVGVGAGEPDRRRHARHRDGRARIRLEGDDPPASDLVGNGDGSGGCIFRRERACVHTQKTEGLLGLGITTT
jgi:dihydrolipoamide dehydrogenase